MCIRDRNKEGAKAIKAIEFSVALNRLVDRNLRTRFPSMERLGLIIVKAFGSDKKVWVLYLYKKRKKIRPWNPKHKLFRQVKIIFLVYFALDGPFTFYICWVNFNLCERQHKTYRAWVAYFTKALFFSQKRLSRGSVPNID